MTRQAFFAGLLAAFVGFASSFAVVLKGLTSVGRVAGSGGVGADGAGGGDGGLRDRAQPLVPAADQRRVVDPGGALLASSAVPDGGFPAAVGAFLLSGALIVIAGFWRPLGRAVAAIRLLWPTRCWRGCC